MPVEDLTMHRLKESNTGATDGESLEASELFLVEFPYQVKSAIHAINFLSDTSLSIGSRHIGNPNLAISNLSVEAVDSYNWRVTADYEVSTKDEEEDDFEQKVEVNFSSWSYQEVSPKLFDDEGSPQAMKNSAGDSLAPIMVDTFMPEIICSIVKNSPRVGDILSQGTVNSSSVTVGGITIPPYYGMLAGVSLEPSITIEDGEEEVKWKHTYRIKIKTDSFKSKVLNAGFNYLDAENENKLTAFLNDDLTPVSTPQPLGATGAPLAEGESPIYLEFLPYVATDFSIFGLPSRFPKG